MAEAIASQLSGGAGRMIDMFWPPRTTFRANGTTPGASVTDRLNANDPQQGTIQYQVNPNAGYNKDIFGRSGATIGAVAAGSPNGMQWSFQGMVMQCALLGQAGAADLALNDEFGAHRVKMIAYFSNPAADIGAAVDNGLFICTAGGGLIDDGAMMRLGTPGLGFRVYKPNTLEVVMRPTQAGAVTRVDILTAADGYDPSTWHCYEIRIISAHGATHALAKFFVDGVLKLTMQWGPGNIMPQTNSLYAGFRTYIASTGGNGIGIAVDSLHFQAARNELNLT